MQKWGLVATIKAPADEILAFAAHHIELGAHRLYLYLDAPEPAAFAHLKAHPKVRVFDCDGAHWRKLGKPRPKKHQVRQCLNATHCYARPPEVGWLAHIDVDEYLWPDAPLGDQLAALPADCHCARVRPIEALDGSGTVFKGFIPPGPRRDAIVQRLYPEFGRYVRGGFLSHTAGKLFLRTGLPDVTFRIHNAVMGTEMNPGERALEQTALCHCHARTWSHWIGAYRYRLQKGSYRADLPAHRGADTLGLTLHELLTILDAKDGKAGLRRFYDEFCADTPERRASLRAEGLLHLCDLELAAKRRKHFPEFARIETRPETDCK